ATTAATERFTCGGVEKQQRLPKPITLAKSAAPDLPRMYSRRVPPPVTLPKAPPVIEPEGDDQFEATEIRDLPIEQRTERGMSLPDIGRLTETTCRWPIGDPGSPGFFFCGNETARGCPYCIGHERTARIRRGAVTPAEAERRRQASFRMKKYLRNR